MAVSPEQREVERKARELKVQEDRLKRRLEQQQRQEEKLQQNQLKLSQRETTVTAKDQDLKNREQQLEQQRRQFEKEQSKQTEAMQKLQRARKRRLSFMLPVLLLAGIGSGYLTYDYYAKQDVFSQRLSQANQNINKLSDVLSKAEAEKTEALQKLSIKEVELSKKQSELDSRQKTLESSVAALTAEKAALLETTKKLELALAESTQGLNDSSDLMNRLSEENEQLKTVLADTEASLTEVKVREQALLEGLEAKTDELIASKQAIDERNDVLEAKTQQYAELEQQLVTLQKEHDVLSEKRDELAKQLAGLTKSSNALKSELASLKALSKVKPETKPKDPSITIEKETVTAPKP